MKNAVRVQLWKWKLCKLSVDFEHCGCAKVQREYNFYIVRQYYTFKQNAERHQNFFEKKFLVSSLIFKSNNVGKYYAMLPNSSEKKVYAGENDVTKRF